MSQGDCIYVYCAIKAANGVEKIQGWRQGTRLTFLSVEVKIKIKIKMTIKIKIKMSVRVKGIGCGTCVVSYSV